MGCVRRRPKLAQLGDRGRQVWVATSPKRRLGTIDMIVQRPHDRTAAWRGFKSAAVPRDHGPCPREGIAVDLAEVYAGTRHDRCGGVHEQHEPLRWLREQLRENGATEQVESHDCRNLKCAAERAGGTPRHSVRRRGEGARQGAQPPSCPSRNDGRGDGQRRRARRRAAATGSGDGQRASLYRGRLSRDAQQLDPREIVVTQRLVRRRVELLMLLPPAARRGKRLVWTLSAATLIFITRRSWRGSQHVSRARPNARPRKHVTRG